MIDILRLSGDVLLAGSPAGVAKMTKERRAGLARLMLRWPEGRAALRMKSESDPVLIELCEGYDLACEAAAYWLKSSAANAAAIAEEYRCLIAELESDIRQRASMGSLCTTVPT